MFAPILPCELYFPDTSLRTPAIAQQFYLQPINMRSSLLARLLECSGLEASQTRDRLAICALPTSSVRTFKRLFYANLRNERNEPTFVCIV